MTFKVGDCIRFREGTYGYETWPGQVMEVKKVDEFYIDYLIVDTLTEPDYWVGKECTGKIKDLELDESYLVKLQFQADLETLLNEESL